MVERSPEILASEGGGGGELPTPPHSGWVLLQLCWSEFGKRGLGLQLGWICYNLVRLDLFCHVGLGLAIVVLGWVWL